MLGGGERNDTRVVAVAGGGECRLDTPPERLEDHRAAVPRWSVSRPFAPLAGRLERCRDRVAHDGWRARATEHSWRRRRRCCDETRRRRRTCVPQRTCQPSVTSGACTLCSVYVRTRPPARRAATVSRYHVFATLVRTETDPYFRPSPAQDVRTSLAAVGGGGGIRRPTRGV